MYSPALNSEGEYSELKTVRVFDESTSEESQNNSCANCLYKKNQCSKNILKKDDNRTYSINSDKWSQEEFTDPVKRSIVLSDVSCTKEVLKEVLNKFEHKNKNIIIETTGLPELCEKFDIKKISVLFNHNADTFQEIHDFVSEITTFVGLGESFSSFEEVSFVSSRCTNSNCGSESMCIKKCNEFNI